MQQVEVGMQQTLERGGILQLKYLRLQQVDKTKHMHVERHVISQSHLAEREAGSTLQQRAQHRQLPANTIICILIYFRQKSYSKYISEINLKVPITAIPNIYSLCQFLSHGK